LGNQRLRVLLWAWETLLPVKGPFPHISHVFAMVILLYINSPEQKTTQEVTNFMLNLILAHNICELNNNKSHCIFHVTYLMKLFFSNVVCKIYVEGYQVRICLLTFFRIVSQGISAARPSFPVTLIILVAAFTVTVLQNHQPQLF
jgi:hypothetical protein